MLEGDKKEKKVMRDFKEKERRETLKKHFKKMLLMSGTDHYIYFLNANMDVLIDFKLNSNQPQGLYLYNTYTYIYN